MVLPSTRRRFYAQNLLYTNAFTDRRFDRQTLLHTDAFTHRRFYTQTLLHTEALHTDPFAHRSVYTLLETDTLHTLHTKAGFHTTQGRSLCCHTVRRRREKSKLHLQSAADKRSFRSARRPDRCRSNQMSKWRQTRGSSEPLIPVTLGV